MASAGRIVLVGTPIGNLGDLSDRARRTLADADALYCEDTRRTRALLSAEGIAAGDRLLAMHAHNERASADSAVARAAAGEVVAVVTDAGMPGVSDPGAVVAEAAIAAGVELDVVPGPAAAVAALVVSGLAGEGEGRWCFEGFLPRSGAGRRARLAAIAAEGRTSVVYEAPHRVARTLADLAEACGAGRRVACARELTKLHQELWRGTLAEASTWVAAHPPRGEWVLVVAGADPAPDLAASADGGAAAVSEALAAAAEAGVDRRRAVRDVAASLGVARRAVYDASLTLRWPAPAPPPAPPPAAGMSAPAGGYVPAIAPLTTVHIVHTLELPSDVASVPVVRNLIRSSLRELGVDEACIADVALAVTEACANVVNHAGSEGGHYRVEVEITAEACAIRVIDAGGGFDPADLVEPGDAAESGRGVALMRALVDDLHFSRGRPGTIVQLTKRLTLDPRSLLHPGPDR